MVVRRLKMKSKPGCFKGQRWFLEKSKKGSDRNLAAATIFKGAKASESPSIATLFPFTPLLSLTPYPLSPYVRLAFGPKKSSFISFVHFIHTRNHSRESTPPPPPQKNSTSCSYQSHSIKLWEHNPASCGTPFVRTLHVKREQCHF